MALVDRPRADCVASELGTRDCDLGPEDCQMMRNECERLSSLRVVELRAGSTRRELTA